MFKNIIEVLTILIPLLPIIFKVFQLLTAKTHNQRLKNLSQRSQVIVEGLERANLTNDEKKHLALIKLSNYAKEVNIKVSADQMDDYIEAAVTFVKTMVK